MSSEIEIYDVVVVGGGPSGVAAAVTAAEQGANTLIIEKNGFFGGSNVAGYSGTIGGLYSSSLSQPLKQQVFGFADRFKKALLDKKAILAQVPFGHTALAPFDPLGWKEVADEMMLEAGVDIMFHTSFVDVIKEKDIISSVIVENKDGRSIIRGKRFIDASGDGDLAFKSGVAYSFGDNGKIQAMTMAFRMAGVDWTRASKYKLEDIWLLVEEAVTTGKYDLPRTHPFIFPLPQEDQAMMNCTAILSPDGRVLYPTKTVDLTFAEIEGRRQIHAYERFVKEYLEGFEKAYIIDSATQIGIRQSRTIKGVYTLTNEDVITRRKFDTSIVKSSWPIEAHNGKDGVTVENLDDDHYEIPFEVMIPECIDNLYVVGRCISAEHEALASARVVAQCFEEGMAAGYASVLCENEGILSRHVDIKKVQDFMISQGSVLK